MQYDLQEAVDFILDARFSLRRRAVRLYGLAVALLLGEKSSAVSKRLAAANPNHNTLILKLRATDRSTAHLLCIAKQMDEAEDKWGKAADDNSHDLRSIRRIAAVRDLYDNEFLKIGGWWRVRHSQSARDFGKKLGDQQADSKNLVAIIEYAARYRPGIDGKSKEISSEVIRRMAENRDKGGLNLMPYADLERYWNKYQAIAPFVYLLNDTEMGKSTSLTMRKNFGRKWRSFANSPELLAVLHRYNQLADHLGDRGLVYTPLKLPESAELPPLTFPPLAPHEGLSW